MFNRHGTTTIAVALAGAAFCDALAIADPDRLFTPEQCFFSASGKGVADAGVALPWNMASGLTNPALLYACRNGSAPVYRSFYTGYARDSLFDRYVLPAGLSYSRKQDAVAAQVRMLSSSFGLAEQEANVTFCRRVWRRADPRGPLDIGVNVRYDHARWMTRFLDTLLTVRSYVDTLGRNRHPDEVVSHSVPPESGIFRENRIRADIGVFKPEFASHLDCGIAVKNVVAWSWGVERPHPVRSVDTAGTIGDTVTIVDTKETYDAGYAAYRGWVAGRYAVVAIGWNLRIGNPGGRFSLSIPFDVRTYGLFDRAMKERYAIHTGLQVHMMRDIFIRAGYQHAPGIVASGARDLKAVHNISFGASMLPPGLPVVIDCYVTHHEWGLSVSADY
ncbi:MAG: hypothetical protein JXA71_16910 [Chitinispirillaceae bacterium]|nr:hypothetical protein [Chitinispirillaceae bacterium]